MYEDERIVEILSKRMIEEESKLNDLRILSAGATKQPTEREVKEALEYLSQYEERVKGAIALLTNVWTDELLTDTSRNAMVMIKQQRKELEELFNNKIQKIIERYAQLPQNTHTNNLAHNLTTKITNPAQLDFNGMGTITDKGFRLYIEGYDKLVNGANTSAVKLCDAAVIYSSKNHDPLARIPLKEYMELRGLKDEDKARKQIKNDIEVLKGIKFDYKGTGNRKGDWINISLYGGRSGIYKGVIEFRFTPEFYASIPGNQFMFIPREYFSTSDKYNPHAAYFIRRIAEHKRMNLGKANENIIGIETLINSSPIFPKYEETKGNHFDQLILKPFERDMDVMESIKWHYTGEPPTTYNEFIKSSVVITWVDYPDVGKLTQHKRNSLDENKQPKKTLKNGPKTCLTVQKNLPNGAVLPA